MAQKKPEIKTLQYLDWIDVKNYLREKYKDTDINEACYQVVNLGEIHNGSYVNIDTNIEYYVDLDDKYRKYVELFCELFTKEYPDIKDEFIFHVWW